MSGMDPSSGDETLPPPGSEGSISRHDSPSPPTRGAQIGRYIVLDLLGRGGMGAVYEAFDPDLERVVALKLMRRGGERGRSDSDVQGARTLQEARAMARLRHPNIITVYDIGVLDGSVFVAMELIRGQTLGAWVGESSRTRAEILAAFRAAGAGLAAAHDAGIVHRDFKPDNVLVDESGRVVVLDFGLAAETGSGKARTVESSGAIKLDGDDLHRLTATGGIMGTPAYMAPEQFRGRSTDPRSDQFAFCVALYEALVGTRPFSGDSLAALAASVCRGHRDDIPSGVHLPPWIATVLERGLSVKPDERWPDMHALLHALGRDPTRLKRWVALTGVVALGVGVAVGGSVLRERSRVAACDNNEALLADVWEPPQREAAKKRFEEVAGDFGLDTFGRVDKPLTEHRDAWLAAHAELCRNEPPDRALRFACLDLARADLTTRSSVFVDADRPTVEHAVSFVSIEAQASRCLEDEYLARWLPTPPHADVQADVASVRAKLAEARALRLAGALGRAREASSRALAMANETEYRPVIAEAVSQIAYVDREEGKLSQAEEGLWKALAIATESDVHPQLVAEIWVTLVYLVGRLQARSSEARRWLPMVAALVHDLDDDVLTRRFDGNAGAVMLREGDLDAAETYFQRALDTANARYGEGTVTTTNYLNNIGVIQGRRGDLTAAIATFERVLEVREASLGPDHPTVAVTLYNLANGLRESDPNKALRLAQRSLEIRERLLPGHTDSSLTWQLIAAIRRELGQFEESLEAAERALELQREQFDGPHPEIEVTLINLSLAAANLKRREQAMTAAQRLVAQRKVRLGDFDPAVADGLRHYIEVCALLGEEEQGRAAARELLAIAETTEVSEKALAQARAALESVEQAAPGR